MNSTVQKFNSLVPMASNVISSNAKSLNKVATNAYNSVNNAVNSGLGSLGLAPAANAGAANVGSVFAANTANAGGSFGSPLSWFVGFLLLFHIV